MMDSMPFRELSQRYKTPYQVQKLVRRLKYNTSDTIFSAERCWQEQRGHCLEAALLAAAILECRGYPPLVVSIASWDQLDHVLFVFQKGRLWGSIGRSRDEGLHGRAPRYRRLRDLVYSYADPYVDSSGRIIGYGLTSLEDSGTNWRHSPKNLWKLERFLNHIPHRDLHTSEARFQKARRKYFSSGHPRQPEWW